MSILNTIIESGCIGLPTTGDRHAKMDVYGKANNLTVVFAAWHLSPEYRIFRTGSLLSRNEEYPSGLVVVDNHGMARKYTNE